MEGAMSDATKAALDDAIAAHINDTTEGGIVTGYVMQTAYFSTETENHGTSGYYVEVAENQAFHIGKGLASMLEYHYEQLFYSDDEDE